MAPDAPCVLVVEDNLLIAMDLKRMINACGCRVIGPVQDTAAALEIISEHNLHGAVLDVNIGKERVWPVAEALQDKGVPFVIVTGYLRVEVPEQFRDRPILAKPASKGAIADALAEIGVISR